MFWRCLLRSGWQSKIWNFSYVHLLINNNAWPPIWTQSTTLFSKLTFEQRPHAARYVHSSVHVQFCEAVSWSVYWDCCSYYSSERGSLMPVETHQTEASSAYQEVYGYFANTSASRCIQVFVCMCACAYVPVSTSLCLYMDHWNIVIDDIEACVCKS